MLCRDAVFAYMSGLFAGMGTCVLPVLSVMIAQKGKRQRAFAMQFFLAQFAIFAAINMGASMVYSFFEVLRPAILLTASFIVIYIAYTLYKGKTPELRGFGGMLGLALSPCSIGFVIATAGTSFNPVTAIVNAFLFSLGVVTPLFFIAYVIGSAEALVRHSRWIETITVVALIVVSYYLAYLAGASWRWLP